MVSIIVAYAENRVIGKSNDLPWYLPADLKRFKDLTTGHTVIMGRKTFQSIIARLGKPLPNRVSIVLSNTFLFQSPDVGVVDSLTKALAAVQPEEEVFIIGGEAVFTEGLAYAERLYVTEIRASFEGDVYFPVINKGEWHETKRTANKADEKNLYDYDFVMYERTS